MKTHSPFAERFGRQRRGISLMEVLISVFVISIGLLSVITLLPMANFQAEKGTAADRGAIVGKHALRTFRARDMGNPSNWLFANGNAVSITASDTASPLNSASAKAFCIDPRMIARHGNAAAVFPIGGTPNMPRINLRREITGGAMGQLMASQVFEGYDDLAFEIPDDQKLPPVQQDAAGKRASRGQFSWLATLVREGPGDTYTLSIVVFDGRDPQLNLASEHKYTCNFLGTAPFLGGGEVTLTSNSGGSTDPKHVENKPLVELSPGNYVLVAATAGSLFRWYRVNGTGSDDDIPSRNVTLIGADWPGGNAQATILPGVIAVYERTITLNSTSLWQP